MIYGPTDAAMVVQLLEDGERPRVIARRRGQPSIYFPIGDHVNVSWCCSHTNASGVISTSHIVASHITKLLLSFRQILQFRF